MNDQKTVHSQPVKGLMAKSALVLLVTIALLFTLSPVQAEGKTPSPKIQAMEQHVADLAKQLKEATAELEKAKVEEGINTKTAASSDQEDAAPAEPESTDITLGPMTIGGAMRVNYVIGDYSDAGDSPSRGGNGGNFELDTFRLDLSLDYQQWIGTFQYRWYDGYNFLHTGWLGYDFEDAGQVQAGINRVPFGPGPYGVSQSWFFDQHYYVGLADDQDLGIKYLVQHGNWDLAAAWYYSGEGNWNGASEDSARYSYDAVTWRSAIDENGDIVSSAVNGYEERNQFNMRAIYGFEQIVVPTDIGISIEYGQLNGKQASDGSHWAASIHMVNSWDAFKIASQLTRYGYDIEADNPLGTDELLPMGAFDFAWPTAAKAWIGAISMSYTVKTPQIPWLDSVLPYVEYSSIMKDADNFNNSDMFIVGAAWASGGWYIYTDYALSDGNLFIGDKGDDYTNINHGVGDFGVNGNDQWNYRFNINFGYYF